MTELLQTTIAGSLPKPAWLAEPGALGPVAARRRRARRGHARRRPPGAARPGRGRHRHRHRRRTDAPAFRDDVHRGARRCRLRAPEDRAHPQSLRRRRSRRRRPGRAPAPVSTSTTRAFLRGETGRKVKFTLPGPMTMVDTLYDAHYKSREKLAWAFAEILNEEARAIEAAGVDVIQFDEPAFNVYFDEVRDWGVRTLERAAQGLACTTAVHICYGYGIKANIDWKKTLGTEWRQYEQTFPLLARSAIRPGFAGMRELARADRPDRAPGRQGRAGRRDRRRDRAGRDARRRSPRRSGRRCATCRPSASTRAPTAAWSRSRGASPAASSARWRPGPPWSAPRPEHVRQPGPPGLARGRRGTPAPENRTLSPPKIPLALPGRRVYPPRSVLVSRQ